MDLGSSSATLTTELPTGALALVAGAAAKHVARASIGAAATIVITPVASESERAALVAEVERTTAPRAFHLTIPRSSEPVPDRILEILLAQLLRLRGQQAHAVFRASSGTPGLPLALVERARELFVAGKPPRELATDPLRREAATALLGAFGAAAVELGRALVLWIEGDLDEPACDQALLPLLRGDGLVVFIATFPGVWDLEGMRLSPTEVARVVLLGSVRPTVRTRRVARVSEVLQALNDPAASSVEDVARSSSPSPLATQARRLDREIARVLEGHQSEILVVPTTHGGDIEAIAAEVRRLSSPRVFHVDVLDSPALAVPLAVEVAMRVFLGHGHDSRDAAFEETLGALGQSAAHLSRPGPLPEASELAAHAQLLVSLGAAADRAGHAFVFWLAQERDRADAREKIELLQALHAHEGFLFVVPVRHAPAHPSPAHVDARVEGTRTS